MNKILEERVKNKLIRIGRKNRVLRIAMIPALFVAMFFFHCCGVLSGNGKRLAMLALTFVLVPVYSSFSFPSFVTASRAQYSLYVDGAEEVFLAQETELDPGAAELLEDADVLEDSLEASDYSGTSHGYAMADQYDASEILAFSGERNGGSADGAQAPEPEYTARAAEDGLQAEDSCFVFSADDWRLLLINKQNSIPDDYTFTLGVIKGNMQCDERIIDDLLDMLQAAGKDGIELVICSPYRDMERQEYLFNRKINRYMDRGFSYMEAYRLANEYVTVPGASEHQIGLALDIVCSEYTSLTAGFGDTEAGKWLAEHSCEYGFILRYPLDKEYITGIEYEPWHFRYVGVEAATVITEQKLTLEEFWEDYVYKE